MTRRGWVHGALLLVAVLWTGLAGGCDDCNPPPPKGDPHVKPDGRGLEPRRDVLSPVTLRAPIYACANTALVYNYIPKAKVSVLINGVVAGSGQSQITTGLLVTVNADFVAGQKITAVQEFDGFTSTPSNEVTVTSHTEDYPNGMPEPRLEPTPLLACGRATGIDSTVPGAWVRVIAENPAAGGGFDPPATIGTTVGGSYAITSAFAEGARIHAESGLCTDRSPNSPIEIVQPAPASLPPPSLDPVNDGTEVVAVRRPPPDGLGHGATLDVFADDEPPPGRVGGQPTPGGPPGQLVAIHPAATHPGNYTATQALCVTSPPSTPVSVTPCSELGAPIIRPPLPGDTTIQVIDAAPGARILVYADGEEVGDGGGGFVNLVRPLEPGEVVKVIQQVGSCRSAWVYEVIVECSVGGDPSGCTADWPAFRQNALRNGQQTQPSALGDPYLVKRLQVRWQFRPPGAIAFRASPIVFEGRVFVGNGNGRLYALDAVSGALLWQYPPAAQPALTSQYQSNASSYGIAASAAIARFRDRNLVILAAPDQSIGAGLGSSRLFALDPASGGEVWKSPEVAVLNGKDWGNENQLHEQIGYSSPLVFGERVYVGIADHGDNPIQNGRIAAVDVHNGSLISSFSFLATGRRGGGIWSSLAGGLVGGGIYATTGNTKSHCEGCDTEPKPNHGLSLLRVDAGSGALVWKLQPVPFELDLDPDWASGPALADTSCGPLAASTQKDGWSYAAAATSASAPAPSVRWQFPATGWPFSPGDGTVHGDTRFLIPGAIWNDVFLTTTAGDVVTTAHYLGFNQLHALELCSGSRLRWIKEIPGTITTDYQLGPPTVTRGIVFVGTTRGHLVALADPSRWYTAAVRCSHPQVSVADCAPNGFSLVPDPKVLLDLDLDPGSSSDRIATEPVLAGGRVFVATSGGVVYMLEPR